MRHGLLATLVAANLCAAVPAAATTTFVGDYDVTLSGVDPGLNVFYVPVAPDVDGLDFTLDVGQSTTIDLFRIYTTETAVNDDDVAPEPILVAFDFTLPTGFGGGVGGATQGQGARVFGNYLFDRGTVTWANGGTEFLHFGAGGILKVDLDDQTFNAGLFDLYPGAAKGATVKARFSLIAEPAAVPEPATWALMIGGFGMTGAILRRRRPAPVHVTA